MFKKTIIVILTATAVITGSSATYVMLDSHISKQRYFDAQAQEKKDEAARKANAAKASDVYWKCRRDVGIDVDEAPGPKGESLDQAIARIKAKNEAQDKREKALAGKLKTCIDKKS
jgi:hypothetical protein